MNTPRMLRTLGGALLACALLAGLAGCSGGGGTNSLPSVAVTALVYSSGVEDGGVGEIYLLKLNGTQPGSVTRLTENTLADFSPSLSPDGSQVAYVETDGTGVDNIFVVAIDNAGVPIASTRVQITNDALGNDTPVWTPDGAHLLFVRRGENPDDGQPAGIYEVAVPSDGQPPVLMVASGDNPAYSPAVSGLLAYSKRAAVDGIVNVYTIYPDRPGTEIKLTRGIGDPDFEVHGLCWSPNGRSLAFDGYTGGGNGNIYTVLAAGNSVPTALTTANDNGAPVWLSNATIVFFSDNGREAGRHALFTLDVNSGQQTLLWDNEGDIVRGR